MGDDYSRRLRSRHLPFSNRVGFERDSFKGLLGHRDAIDLGSFNPHNLDRVVRLVRLLVTRARSQGQAETRKARHEPPRTKIQDASFLHH
jgi:hypothetical protein